MYKGRVGASGEGREAIILLSAGFRFGASYPENPWRGRLLLALWLFHRLDCHNVRIIRWPSRVRWRRRNATRRRPHAVLWGTRDLHAGRIDTRRPHEGTGPGPANRPAVGVLGRPWDAAGGHGRTLSIMERKFVQWPHLHGDGPVRLNHIFPDAREDHLAVGADQVVVARLNVWAKHLHIDEGLLNELFHTLGKKKINGQRVFRRKDFGHGRSTLTCHVLQR